MLAILGERLGIGAIVFDELVEVFVANVVRHDDERGTSLVQQFGIVQAVGVAYKHCFWIGTSNVIYQNLVGTGVANGANNQLRFVNVNFHEQLGVGGVPV